MINVSKSVIGAEATIETTTIWALFNALMVNK